jgi:hypothetical protein
MAKIFISYKRNVIPDTPVATAVFESLRHDHDVFMDTTIQVGEKWAERIQNAIKESDYLIIFLSENSVHSEMVIAEIETAHHTGKANGKPAILPVRLAYNEPLVYPISAYLNPLQWALWDSESDTPRLLAELQRAVSGGSLPSKLIETQAVVLTPAGDEVPTAFANIPPRDLGSPEGTMPHQSLFTSSVIRIKMLRKRYVRSTESPLPSRDRVKWGRVPCSTVSWLMPVSAE